MLNKNGGIAADLTVSVLDSQDGSTSIFPNFEGIPPVDDALFFYLFAFYYYKLDCFCCSIMPNIVHCQENRL